MSLLFFFSIFSFSAHDVPFPSFPVFFFLSPSVPVLSSIKTKCQCLSLSSDFCALLPCLNKNHKCFYRHVLDWISLKAFNSNRLGAEKIIVVFVMSLKYRVMVKHVSISISNNLSLYPVFCNASMMKQYSPDNKVLRGKRKWHSIQEVSLAYWRLASALGFRLLSS